MKREMSEAVAMTPKQGEVIALCRECRAFASNNFRTPPQLFIRFPLASIISERPVVY
jgi:hypothetical protein